MQKNKLLVLIVVLMMLAGGAFTAKKVLGRMRRASLQQSTWAQATPSSSPTGEVAGATNDRSVKTITINGGSFYFKPNEIKVSKGDKVKIVFTNDEGFHDFVLDEFNVKIGPIAGGQTAEATFTADKSGTFEFYCSVGNHRARGQVGKITVE